MNTELRRPAPHWTIEQLRKHFGMIPAGRILRQPPPGTATEKDARIANEKEGHLCELIDGTLVEKGVGTNESRIALLLGHFLHDYLEKHPIGDASGVSGLVRLGPGNLRAPDLSFFLYESLPSGQIPANVAYPAIVPDLAVEVLSRSNTRKEIDRKIKEFFRAGTKIIWVIDPRKKLARIYRSIKEFAEINEKGSLVAESVLPGFSVPLSKLLAPRRPPERNS
jgi:Uma2 family endonuclease